MIGRRAYLDLSIGLTMREYLPGVTAMNDHPSSSHSIDIVSVAPRKPLSPQAQRALAEAEERRAKAAQENKHTPKEHQGPKGPEPTRYGDWEHKGICSDF